MKKNGFIWQLFLPLLYICFSCCQHNDLVSNNIVRKTTKANDQYHMNWGNDGAYDGWFSTANWDVAGYSFGANKHMIRVNL